MGRLVGVGVLVCGSSCGGGWVRGGRCMQTLAKEKGMVRVPHKIISAKIGNI